MLYNLIDFYKQLCYITTEEGELMAFTHKCKRCGKVIEYTNAEELKNHFYFKGGYFRNVCKECECKEHAEKFKEGKYNYRLKNLRGYETSISVGSMNGGE